MRVDGGELVLSMQMAKGPVELVFESRAEAVRFGVKFIRLLPMPESYSRRPRRR